LIITGTVRDPAGLPIAAARVFITYGPGPFPDLATLIGGDGKFTLAVSRPGGYRLACHAEGFDPESVDATVTTEVTTVEIRLRPDQGRA